MFHGLVTLLSIVSISLHRIEYLERVVKEFNSTSQELQEKIQSLELTIVELNSRLTESEAATTESTTTELVTTDGATTEMTTTATGAKKKEMKTTETTTSTSTGTDTTVSSMAPYFNTSQCEFNVSDICYWSYVNFTNRINFAEAQQICADKGSVPAYFPTELAYNKTMESLRVKMVADGRTWANVYTGVIVDDQTLAVTYPDTKVYMKWLPGNPYKFNDRTSVFLQIRASYHDIYQGMWNYSPSYLTYGVVCQNNLN